jgi:general secretion pathway protein D
MPITTPPILQGFIASPGSTPASFFAPSGVATSVTPFGPHNKVKVFAKGLSLNTITYSLNIINVFKQYIEVIGRPTLTTQIGKPAEFFSGEDVKIAIAGNFGGNVTQTPVGNTLKVTPLSLENGYVTIDVELIGSLLTDTETQLQALAKANTPIVFTLDRSNVHTTIKVKLGETIMLAGTSERVDFQTTSGVPFLDQIPLIQYFFSNQTTLSERKHVMYLITPRSYKANLRETFQYFNKGEEEDICRPNLSDLERRYKNWFNPHLNHILILKGLGPVYRDFRAGDFLPLQWTQFTTLEEQVTQIIEFLWW